MFIAAASDEFLRETLKRASRLSVALQFGPLQTYHLFDGRLLESRPVRALFETGEASLPPVPARMLDIAGERTRNDLATRFGWARLAALYSMCSRGRPNSEWGAVSIDTIVDHFSIRGIQPTDPDSIAGDFDCWKRTGTTLAFLRSLGLVAPSRFANLWMQEEFA